MSTLWKSGDAAVWKRALADYTARIDAREVARLPELDAWISKTLTPEVLKRDPPYVTLAELSEVTSWKMKRGTYRARNLVLVKSNSEAAVKKQSGLAFAAAPDPRKPVALLAELAGVGPATASAVLATRFPEHYPFFDEDVASQIPGLGEVAFTIPYYLRYAAALKARAEALGGKWTAHAVAQALWATR